jgi:hypothetical protein
MTNLMTENVTCTPTTPRELRRWVAGKLAAHVPGPRMSSELMYDVALCVSELVSHAVRAGCSLVTLALRVTDSTVRLSVLDDASAALAGDSLAPDTDAGRSAQLLDAVSDRWGVNPAEHGSEFWVELRRAS